MFEYFKKSTIIQNVLKLGSYSILSQLIGSLSMLLITRIYGPEGLGIQGAFLAALSVLIPLAALRFPQAIVVATDDFEARIVEQLSIVVSIIVFAVLMLLVFLQTENTARLLGLESHVWLVFALPIAVLFSGYQEVMNQRLVRMEKFGEIGKTSVYQALITNGGRIGSGLVQPHSGNLIAVSVLNPFVWGLLVQWASRKYLPEKLPKEFSVDKVKSTARKFRDFPLFRVPTDMVYAISEAVPVFFLTYFFGPTEAGFYTLSRTLLIIPNRIIGQAVSSVIYARMANLNRQERPFSSLLGKSSLLLLIGPGLLIVLLVILIQPFFSLIFGAGWEGAGMYAFWVSIWMACNLANSPATRVANIINRQREVLIFSVIFLILQLSTLVGIMLAGYDTITLVAGYSLISACRALALSVLLQHFTRVHESKW